jgi:hypothetical protein
MRTIMILPIAALFTLGCQNNDWKTTDKVEVISEAKSPDGKHVATVFSCSGGGAAGYTYTNVNLRRATDDFNQRDFLLGKHNWNSFADIEVLWNDAKNLEVSYRWLGDNPDHQKMNNQTVPEKGGVRVFYVLKEDVPMP